MEDAPGRAWPVADWAAMAGTSIPAFARSFRAATDRPPHRFLVEHRVALAGRALGRPGSDVDAIADALGFSGRAHVGRVFARVAGHPPRG